MIRPTQTSAALVLLVSTILPARADVPLDIAACEALRAGAPDGEKPARCLFQLATGNSASRAAAARRLQELHAAHPKDPWFSLELANLKWQPRNPAQMGEAEELYRRTAESAHRLGSARAEYRARAGLIRMLQDAGSMDEAAKEVESAVKVAETSGDPLLLARAGILRAKHWTARGELVKAYDALRSLQKDVEKVDEYALTREYLFALGNPMLETGRFEEAEDTFRRLVDLAQAQGDVPTEASARFGLARTRWDELNEMPTPEGRQKVLRLARESLAVARTAGSQSLEVQSLWLIGLMGEDQAEAVAHLERCFAVAPTPREKSTCRGALARRLAGSRPSAADKAIHEALSLAQSSGDVLARTTSWRDRMRASWAMAPPERALANSWAALGAIEALRDQQGGSARQPGLFSTWAEDYYWLSGRLLESKDLETAFEVIERMRSRTLIDALGLRQGPGASPALKARRADIFLDIARVQRRLLDASLSRDVHARARAELVQLELEESALRSRIAQADPAFAAIRQSAFASLEEIRAALAPDEALLSFQIAPWKDLAGDFGGGSWLLVCTRDAVRVYRLPDRTELRPIVIAFTGMFEARDGSEAHGASVLYKKLLIPALAELPSEVRRLMIVPDDSLHRLPFAALRPEPESEPLAARYEIALAPSATLWLHWREVRPASAITPALVLADPVTLVTEGNAASERAAAFLTPIRLGPLPYARAEGKSVVRHLSGVKLLVREEASEAFIKRNGGSPFGLLHFAAHAMTDDVNPDRSGIYLSPGNDQEDGVLQVREIAELELGGRIVVLSTCESASGGILRGEGVMGLARAFFQAGAHTVVASLWPLRDDDGAALFDRFYRHLSQGKSVAAALQAAQRDRMNDGAPAEAWAGVVVLGDGDRIPVPGGRGHGLVRWTLGLIAVLAAALLAYWVRRARQRRRTIA